MEDADNRRFPADAVKQTDKSVQQQIAELNGRYYAEDPATYFSQRLAQLLLYAGNHDGVHERMSG